jgi:hypothetical protein
MILPTRSSLARHKKAVDESRRTKHLSAAQPQPKCFFQRLQVESCSPIGEQGYEIASAAPRTNKKSYDAEESGCANFAASAAVSYDLTVTVSMDTIIEEIRARIGRYPHAQIEHNASSISYRPPSPDGFIVRLIVKGQGQQEHYFVYYGECCQEVTNRRDSVINFGQKREASNHVAVANVVVLPTGGAPA